MLKQIRFWDEDPLQADKDAFFEMGLKNKLGNLRYQRQVYKDYVLFDIKIETAQDEIEVDKMLMWLILALSKT